MAIAKKELVSCKGFQHLMLKHLDTMRDVFKQYINDKHKSWPGYTWYYNGKRFVVCAWGFTYISDGVRVTNTGCYYKEVFQTVRQRDAIFAVEFFRCVFNAPVASRHNWHPNGKAVKHIIKKPNPGYKKNIQRINNSTSHSSQGLPNYYEREDPSSRTGRPANMAAASWINLLRTLGYGNHWRCAMPISCLDLWLQFESWVEDVERFNTIAFDGISGQMEALGEYAQDNDMEQLAPRMWMLVQDLKTSLQAFEK